jgi:hypothetical protein
MKVVLALFGLVLIGCPHVVQKSLPADAIAVPDVRASIVGKAIEVSFVLENRSSSQVTVESIDWCVKVANDVLAHTESSVQLRLPPGSTREVHSSVAVETLGLLTGSRSSGVIEGTLSLQGHGASPPPSFRLPVTLVVEGR